MEFLGYRFGWNYRRTGDSAEIGFKLGGSRSYLLPIIVPGATFLASPLCLGS